MSALLDLISPVWLSTLSRISDMIAWCLVLMMAGRVYRRKVGHPLLCAVPFLCFGVGAQLFADVLTRNNTVMYEANFVFWLYLMLETLFYGSRKQKVLHALLFGVAWPQTVQLSQTFEAMLLEMDIYIPLRIMALGIYLLFLYWAVKNAPSADAPLRRDYLISCGIVCLINMAICLSSPIRTFYSGEVDYWFYQVISSGGTLLVEALVLHMVHLLMFQNEQALSQVIWHSQRAESAGLVNRTAAFEEEYRRLQHEIGHAASLAALLIQKQEYDEAQNVLAGLQQNVENSRSSGSSPSVVDTLVEDYRMKADAMKVRFTADVHLTDMLPVSSIDLCSMISNMLSNALEASVNCAEAFVSIEIHPVKRYLMIRVKNHVSTDVLKDNPNLITTKQNSAIHGKGTRIMRQICQKYNGMLNFEVQDLTFSAEALLLLGG